MIDYLSFVKEKSFISLQPLYSLDNILVSDRSVPFYSFLPCNNFWELLNEYESQHSYSYSKLKTRYAMELMIMVPKHFKSREICFLTQKFMKHFCPDGTELPYDACLIHKGKGRYIQIIYSERLYNPDGFLKPIISKGDFYRNKVTGKRCLKTDTDAVLVSKNGEVIGCKRECFSNKISGCGTGNGSDFNTFIDYLKELFLKIISEIGCDIYSGVHIKKLSREKHSKNKFYLRNITKINKVIYRVEAEITRLKYILSAGYFIQDYDTKLAYFRFLGRWKNILSSKHIKYNKRYTFFFNMTDQWQTVDKGLSFVSELFNQELEQFYRSYVWDMTFV